MERNIVLLLVSGGLVCYFYTNQPAPKRAVAPVPIADSPPVQASIPVQETDNPNAALVLPQESRDDGRVHFTTDGQATNE